MVVQPDFLDHWKTHALISRVGELGPLAVLKLWAYCHNRREDSFHLTPAKLAGICKWNGDPEKLFEAMTDSGDGFLDLNEDGTFTVHDWWETNRSMTSHWGNQRAKKHPEKQGSKTNRKQIENKSKTTPSTLLYSTPSKVKGVQGEKEASKSKKQPRASSMGEVADYCAEKGLLRSDGEWLFDKWEGNGWTNNSKSMKCWKSTVRSWARMGSVFPSHKANANGAKPSHNPNGGFSS